MVPTPILPILKVNFVIAEVIYHMQSVSSLGSFDIFWRDGTSLAIILTREKSLSDPPNVKKAGEKIVLACFAQTDTASQPGGPILVSERTA